MTTATTQAQGRVISVSSGKGGVRKTNISVNLAIALVKRGHRVCVFDADTSLANVNILLNIQPELTLEQVLDGHKKIEEEAGAFVCARPGIRTILRMRN